MQCQFVCVHVILVLVLQKYTKSVAKYKIIEIFCIFATQKEVKKGKNEHNHRQKPESLA